MHHSANDSEIHRNRLLDVTPKATCPRSSKSLLVETWCPSHLQPQNEKLPKHVVFFSFFTFRNNFIALVRDVVFFQSTKQADVSQLSLLFLFFPLQIRQHSRTSPLNKKFTCSLQSSAGVLRSNTKTQTHSHSQTQRQRHRQTHTQSN